jgi:hypothetical protein
MPYHLGKTELIGMEAIQDIIELVLWTLFVLGERIVSLLLVSDSETGRTELMKKYRKNKGVHFRRRFTAYGVKFTPTNQLMHVYVLCTMRAKTNKRACLPNLRREHHIESARRLLQ